MNRWVSLILFVIAMALTGTARAETPEQKVFEQAREQCRSFENGVMTTTGKEVRHMDVTGDGVPDTIIDSFEFRCKPAASMFCGTGGCQLWVIVGDTIHEFRSKGWDVVKWANLTVLLLQVHGSECGGTNLRSCVRAEVWSEGDFHSVGDNQGLKSEN
jgi:hypothetical protein